MPSGVVIQDNHMWDYSRCGARAGDAVYLDGVHVTVSHNHLHHGQYNAIRWAVSQLSVLCCVGLGWVVLCCIVLCCGVVWCGMVWCGWCGVVC